MKGFIEFIRKQGVVGLAVGFILGGALSQLIAAVVNDLINPLLALGLGRGGFASSTVQVLGAQISYGHFFSVLVNFLVIAAVVYFGVTGLGLDKLDQKKEG